MYLLFLLNYSLKIILPNEIWVQQQKKKKKKVVSMKLSLEGKTTLTVSLKRTSQQGATVTMWNHKNAPEYTLPLTLIIGLVFQIEKPDLNVSVTGSVSSPASRLCRVKNTELNTESKGSLDTHTSPPHFPKCHSLWTLMVSDNVHPEEDDKTSTKP